MAESIMDLYRSAMVAEDRQPSIAVENTSPVEDSVNASTAEYRPLNKRDRMKMRKKKREERALAELDAAKLTYANGQETVYADGLVAVEPIMVANGQGLEPAGREADIEVVPPEEEEAPEAESAPELVHESTLVGHSPTAETDIPPAAPDEPASPIYLPFSSQHKLMVYLQQRLESMCFVFAQRVMPHALDRRGWDCAEMVQLQHWMRDSVFQEYVEGKILDVEQSAQMLDSMIEIWRCAVNRKRIDTTLLETLLRSALELARILEESSSVDEIGQLRDNVIQATQRLAEETQILQARYETKLQGITAARAKLDILEEKTKAALSKRLEQSQSMANGRIIMFIREAECSTPKVALPEGSTTRSCLDWMNDLESSLALGEDDRKDFVG
ncbi:hypothetical protein NOF04DRAFT_9942 [Fusarium oxysporum II5]|uniref:Uncharacterized protein n=3 Tax=Fusarium oxysporum species complex TaxID=171631 RepID=N1RT62_FUSC4|nr:uncharacterized protein FOIG_11587 [Fusarium odoratissimum NRRL 54006]EMT67367.1 hypothetical protein FOC4_g10005456 [Fusarium odoratissimum]EXL96047.1 hypothetical protein FOIG_11587 [Fusarium odoratissimum NRRL 54006]KAK2123835.1 hypothetical protein NOF04DRAFT_9942 [Fusarium oxysporum II5]TXB95903.1 hypothetical protein FocTR4_00016284 [Fusarium oxysporum f. sp. cubense]